MVLSYVPSLMTGDLLIGLLPLCIRKPHNNTDTFTLYHGTFLCTLIYDRGLTHWAPPTVHKKAP